MHQSRGVRRCEAATGGEEGREDRAPARVRALDPHAERLPLDELHRDEVLTFRRTHLEDGDDVRMRRLRHRTRLAEQPGARVRAARVAQHLERASSGR